MGYFSSHGKWVIQNVNDFLRFFNIFFIDLGCYKNRKEFEKRKNTK
jgi:hypothetical protein